MDKRTLLAVVLSLAVLFGYQTFFVKPPVKTQPAPTQQEATVASQTAAKPAAAAAEKTALPAAAIQPGLTGRLVAAPAAAGTERDVVVETPLYRAVFTTRGAALKSFQLKQYKTALENNEDLVDIFYRLIGQGKPKAEGQSKPVELVHVSEGMPRPLSISFPDSTVNIPEDGFYEADGSTLDMTQGTESQKADLYPDLSGRASDRQDLHLPPGQIQLRRWRSGSITLQALP